MNLIEPEKRYHGNIKCILKKKSRRFEEEITDLQVFWGDSRKKIKIEEIRGVSRSCGNPNKGPISWQVCWTLSVWYFKAFTLLPDYWQFYFILISISRQSINTLSLSDVTKILLPITNELILLPIITEIMEDKVIETITYIRSVSKRKPSINKIKTHLLKIGN